MKFKVGDKVVGYDSFDDVTIFGKVIAIEDYDNKEYMIAEEHTKSFNFYWFLETQLRLQKDAICSSGTTREFPSGAKRDDASDKPPMELLPYDLLERLATHYGNGAKHYGSNDWRKGQPASVVIGSMQRHLSKAIKGDTSEDHFSAIVWNALALMNIDEYYKDDNLLNDIGDWFIDGKPTGQGTYKDKE